MFLIKEKRAHLQTQRKKAPAEKYITLFNVLKSNWVQRRKAEGLVFVEIGDYTKKEHDDFYILINPFVLLSLSYHIPWVLSFDLHPHFWGSFIRFCFSSSDMLNTCDITAMLQQSS